jgi:hypothetical protein
MGHTISGIAVQGFNILKEVLNRLIGIFDFLLALLGILPAKKLRLRFVILRDEKGLPLVADNVAMRAYEETVVLLSRAARLTIIPSGWKVVNAPYASPRAALDVRCTDGAWSDDAGEAGAYYRSVMAKTTAGTLLGYGAPLTVFIVRKISDKNGCSLGALTDYVTVEAGTVARTPRLIAHEIGHACGLWHTDDKANCMCAIGPGEKLTRWQVAVLRNSRHVTYL